MFEPKIDEALWKRLKRTGGEMTDNPQGPQERRRSGRTGPLGDDEGEATRQIPTGGSAGGSEDETRQVPRQESARRSRREDPERTRVAPDEESPEERETRVIRTDSARSADGGTARQGTPYARGYFESEEERQERLREIYGGVDWLASFLGFVFAAVAGSFLFALASLIFVPLGISVEIGATLTAAAITALVLLAVLIFLTYFFGGYVAGRLARFDGGRNGAMSVFWGLLIGFILFVVGTFLPGSLGESVRDFYQGSLLPVLGSVLDLGAIGIGIVAGGVLVAVLGGILGGKLGSRYHAEIDQIR
ncbi:Hypothetical Protein RradSPS_1121 [Rubrobacter radiotolerans]|uniref:Uncharacterized protein n=2 Tax=Rubrobacter radiotolerans TaxID=42256 RepID=A0A023X2W3_RUBRA|nr:Hypothetical Protein RradSPS_1121 [Rubrobacter radiotolerans]